MATGPIMAIGAVDMLIPPSALTVLLGSLSGISISKLLIGGVVPGLILSTAFVAYIVVRAKLTPKLAPLPLAFLLLAIEFVFRMHRLARAERAPRTDAVSAS